jgi:two-component system sensor histidine kinase CpxA
MVRNAIRYTPDGASVEITIEQLNGDDDKKAILRIRDHGPGVPQLMLANIFLPFQRVPETAETNSQGAGLGLAIADRVVRMHNGSISAVNASDGGLIVEIVLPLVSEARP